MNKTFTRKNALAILCFALAFALLFGTADRLLRKEDEYSATWMRIQNGDVPQVLILGNSHAFCSFVPEILNEMLGVDSALLAASGINSIATTDSLLAALAVGKPEYIVVEANAYTFHYDATAQAHKATALSHINGMPRLIDRAASAYRQFGLESVPQGAFQLLRADLMWKRWRGGEAATAADGTSLLNWHAAGVFDAQAMQAEARRFTAEAELHPDYMDERNVAQFHRLMEAAQQHGVKVLIAKAPTEHQTDMGSDILLHLQTMAEGYGDTFLGLHDFHQDVADMGLTVVDFYDNTHLSRSGAAKLTQLFAHWMGEKTGLAVTEEAVFAYGGENVEAVADGVWRYTAHAVGEDVTYRFILNGEVVQAFSQLNMIDLPLEPAQADQLQVTMRCGEEEITFAFMTTNTCIFS